MRIRIALIRGIWLDGGVPLRVGLVLVMARARNAQILSRVCDADLRPFGSQAALIARV